MRWWSRHVRMAEGAIDSPGGTPNDRRTGSAELGRLNRRRSTYRLLVLLAVSGLLALGSLSSIAAADESWTFEYGDPSPENFSQANAVAVASDGSIYVVGAYFGTFAGFEAVDDFDVFLMKLTAAGDVVWTRTWDPPSGGDYSNLDSYGSPPWLHHPSLGDIAIDGAGNILIMMGGFAVFSQDGDLLTTKVNYWNEVDGGNPVRAVVAQTDSDGGWFLVSRMASDSVFAVDANLELEWGPTDAYGGEVAMVPVASGGVVVVADVPPAFSFQKSRQVVERFDIDGVSMWSVAHNGRCSGHSGPGTVPVFRLGDEVVVLSVEVDGPDCHAPNTPRIMSSYSFETGELVAERQILPLSENGSFYHCLATPDVPVVIDGWEGTHDCHPGLGIDASLSNAYPRIGSESGVAFALAEMRVDDEKPKPVLATYAVSATAVELVETLGLVDGGGIDILGIDATHDGKAVVVGRADGAAALPAGHTEDVPTPDSPSVPAASEFAAPQTSDQPRAIILFNPQPPPQVVDTFADDNDTVFEADIEWMASEGITKGCNPPLNDRFCPSKTVTRGQMAAFLHRALDGIVEPSGESSDFTDDEGSTFAADIAWLSATGITKGCSATEFCPDRPVTRGQMAAFLVRALGYTDDGDGDLFADDNDSIFEADIDKLATAGVTRGCNPPVNDQFCPDKAVTRGQMAAFLHRALG